MVPKPQISTLEGELKLAWSLFPELSGGKTAHVGCWRSGRQNSIPKKIRACAAALGRVLGLHTPHSPIYPKTQLFLESPAGLSCASTSKQLLGAEEE